MRFHVISSINDSSRLPSFTARMIVGFAIINGAFAFAQDNSGQYTDPATGIVYRKVVRTIERPVVETKMQAQESTVYRPEIVVTNNPESRTVYNPVVSYTWEPRMTNRWNPFSQPTVVYQHTPRTHWEARTETVDRKESITKWVAETRKVEIPQQIVSIRREEKIEFEPIGRVNVPAQAMPPNSAEAAIAARLRPIDPNARIQPLYSVPSTSGAYANANTTRNSYQQGMRVNELTPYSQPSYSMPLPAPTAGVAGVPTSGVWR